MSRQAELNVVKLNDWIVRNSYTRRNFATEAGIIPIRLTVLLNGKGKVYPTAKNRVGIMKVTGLAFDELFLIDAG